MKRKRVLIICEFSGAMRDAFRRKGHYAWSNDPLAPEGEFPQFHYLTDECWFEEWDLIIAHPPCTYLCNSGVRWLYKNGRGKTPEPARWKLMTEGAEFFWQIQGLPCDKIAIENPVMHPYARDLIEPWRTQLIQPWQFGHKEMKATELHLKNLPPLKPTKIVGPPPKDKTERRKWQKVHNMSPGPERGHERGKTYAGIAAACAEQWGSL